MNNILIAIDLSDFSTEVAEKGYTLAARLNTSVTLVSVVPQLMDIARPDTGSVIVDNPEERSQETEKSLMKIQEAHPNIPTRIVCFVGDPKTGILETAISENPAFLVVGTHGRTGLSHLLLGSVAEYLVRHSPLPVLVIPYKTEVH